MRQFFALTLGFLLAGCGVQPTAIAPAAAQAAVQTVNITDWGATGDGTCHQLSSAYSTLAAAQAVYPFVSDLTQCIDWAATQRAINAAYLSGPTTNDSAPLRCSTGTYIMSNPIFVDSANNSQGTFAAWAAGTIYANGAQVKYNGIPWASAGSGNVGNPPTSADGYPAKLSNGNIGNGFPLAAVQITNSSPAIVTLSPNNMVANQPVTFAPQQYATPPANVTPALPAGLNINQVYYVTAISGNTFQISATPGGASISTTSAGAGTFFMNTQVWNVAPLVPAPNFNGRISFSGDEGLPSNSGCRFWWQTMWNSGAMYLGPMNGNLIKNIQLLGPSQGNAVYRCNNLTNSLGWVFQDNGGGSSKSTFENIGSNGFYTNLKTGVGTGALNDSNTFIKNQFLNSCLSVYFSATQNYINTMYDGVVSQSTIGIAANVQEGIKVIGGNHSTFTALANSFAISAVSVDTSAGVTLTATVAAPDQYLQAPMCAFGAGQVNTQSLSIPNSLFDGSCGYNVFTINTPHFGIVPFYVAGYNPFTNVIVLHVPQGWFQVYQGTCCSGLTADLAAVTKIYAAEMVTTWNGQIQVDTNHLENPGVPTTVICNCGGFGAARNAELKNVYINYEPTMSSQVCCNAAPSDATLAKFYAQQTNPFIIAEGGVLIDNLSGGNNLGGMDRLLINGNAGSYLEGRHTQNNVLGQVPLFDFFVASNPSPILNGGPNAGQLDGGYFAYSGQAWGAGIWDSPAFFASAAQSGINTSANPAVWTNLADTWRIFGWGSSVSWGVRPAPWAGPCILPTQGATLAGTLPAITSIANLRNRLLVTAGGSGYAVNDTITLAGGTFTTAATVTVTAVTGGAITAVNVANGGVYTVPPTSFTQGSTTGAGTGATFGSPVWFLNYNIPYPMLFGGMIYRACDYKSAAFAGPKYAIGTTNTGYSYFQNLTTTNVPNLRWTETNNAPFIYMDQEALELMFPGLNITLTPDGTNGCSATAESFIVLEVHPTVGYIKVVRSDTNGTAFLPAWGGTGACTNTTIGQAAPNLINPF